MDMSTSVLLCHYDVIFSCYHDDKAMKIKRIFYVIANSRTGHGPELHIVFWPIDCYQHHFLQLSEKIYLEGMEMRIPNRTVWVLCSMVAEAVSVDQKKGKSVHMTCIKIAVLSLRLYSVNNL